uniref:F-box domain-containing protein n=1 Tax=Psilocybe cubensis TaxID=181762 RepID=A0A8H7Y4R5_PSICU
MNSVLDLWNFKLNGGHHKKYLKSPVPYLLKGNDAPTDEEIFLIHTALRKTESKIMTLEPKDGYIRDRYNNYFQSHLNLLSPLRRIPTEILVEIFYHVLEVPADPLYNSPPWKLGHICRLWRRIALDTPWLWAALPPVRLHGNFNVVESRSKLDCLSVLLKRSSTQKISFYSAMQQALPSIGKAILSLLIEHSNRWERISLDISDFNWAHLSSIKGRLESLRSLKLKLLPFSGRLMGDLDTFKLAPALREVCLSAQVFNSVIGLPRSQLQSFAGEIPGSDFNNALSMYPKIEKLSLIPLDCPRIHYASGIPKPLTSLKLLVIQRLPNQMPERDLNLNSLYLPALEELIINYPRQESYGQDIVRMISVSQCRLRKLVLGFSELEPQVILDILIICPSLVDFDIVISNDAFLHTLPNRAIFDAIKNLAQSRCDMVETDFPNQANANSKGHCRLKTLKVDTRPDAFVFDGEEAASYYFGLETALESVDQTTHKIARQLTAIKFADSDTAMLRRGRSERVLKLIEEVLLCMEKFFLSTKILVLMSFNQAIEDGARYS